MRPTGWVVAIALAGCARVESGAPASSTTPVVPAESSVKAAPSSMPPAVSADVGAKVAGSIVVGGGAMKYLRELSDRHGARLSGSPGYADAAAWAEAQLQTAGLEGAHREPFTLPRGWKRGAATAKIAAPVERALHVESVGWSPGTNGPVRGEVVVLESPTPEKIKADANRLAGKIALLVYGKHKRGQKRPPPITAALRDAGVVAYLYEQSNPDEVLMAHPAHANGELGSPILAFDLGHEDGKLIERLASSGPVTVEVSNASALSNEPATVENVTAELRGRDLPNEWVVVCAHLDAWDYGTGSQDNGAGVATVLEVARALKASGYVPRRSLRFILWGGEEQGLVGSRAWVKAHEAELGSIVAVVNDDNGAGALQGWHVEGRDDVKSAIAAFAKERLAGMGADGIDDETTCDTDHCPFMLAGIPTLNLWVDMDGYMKLHHAPSDTFDKVSAANLSNAAAAVALTAIEIADRDAPLAPRLPHEKVAAILKKADLVDELVREKMWTP